MIIVLPGEYIAADVVWRNTGEMAIAPHFRLDLRESGLAFWHNGVPLRADSVLPGATGTVTIMQRVPLDWAPSTSIDVKIDVEEVGKVWEQMDAFITASAKPSIEIVSVTPYVVE